MRHIVQCIVFLVKSFYENFFACFANVSFYSLRAIRARIKKDLERIETFFAFYPLFRERVLDDPRDLRRATLRAELGQVDLVVADITGDILRDQRV